ncbi:MAG: diguanylate cyclase [Gemmatimonadota bacterium]|nr:diguanylate cyclase [Gemmatimonadota bacterium]
MMTTTSPKILVADDDRTTLTTLALALERRGYQVVQVQESRDVLPTLERERPDLLMLDILMPDEDGLQILKKVKADDRWRDLPVLMISVLAPEEATVSALGLGASDFIAKPFRTEELAARVEAQLRASRALREARSEAQQRAGEAAVHAEMLDILREVTEAFAPEGIYRVLTHRVASALKVQRCSMILARAGGTVGTVVVAAENPSLSSLQVQLSRYPEVLRALERNRPVLVADVGSDPLYAMVRENWDRDGVEVTTRSVIAVPFGMSSGETGVFFLRTVEGQPRLTPEDCALAEKVVRTAVSVIEKAYALQSAQSAKERYQLLSRTDPLTGCMNRRALTEHLQSELERADRYELALSILMVDLDHFKQVNDTRGHLTGDDVLQQVAGLLRKELRAVDVVARYGGEEFVMLLPETAHAGAMALAERIREGIATHNFTPESEPLSLTASVGVATIKSEEHVDAEEVLARVDAALYRSKRDGRNLVRS